MTPSLEHEVDIGQMSIAKYSNNPPSPARKKSAGDTDRPKGRHQRRMSSMSHPDLSELKAIDGPTSPSRSHLTRSKTMPRHAMNPLANALELDGLPPVDHTKLPKLRRWMLAFVLVNFDLELGPTVQGSYPPLWLNPAESENIAFSSFPDSLQFDQGSQAHSFRIRDLGLTGEKCSHLEEKRPQSSDGFIYCYSYFTQVRDATSKRGYRQRSIVILTHHQYPALFSHLAVKLGEEFQAHDVPTLEIAYHNVCNWSDPTPGTTVELGFLGSVLHVEIPHTVNDQQSPGTISFQEKFDPKLHILASTAPLTPPPLLLFEACLPNLWSIWECIILCEPILVFGQSPAATSQAIWWFRDLLRPIPLACDIRPYFTIQDKDHSSIVNKLPPKSGILLGVTNPFFEKSCAHWPHVLSLGRRVKHSNNSKAPTIIAGPAPGWKTKSHKRYISKDRALLKSLEDAVLGSDALKTEVSLNLRRHFCSRTATFLVPLNRYLNTLIPTVAQQSVHASSTEATRVPLRLKTFSTIDFLASLKVHGALLPFKSAGKQKEFYERWLRTPAFGMWLGYQEEQVHHALKESAERGVAT